MGKEGGSGNPDIAAFEVGRGVTSVSLERWHTAQSAEESLWMKEGVWWSSDRNEEHEREFDEYRALKERQFSHALEVGCGPFTNLRRIATHATINKVSLLDPLLDRYLQHPGARYDTRHLILDQGWPPTLLQSLAVKSGRISRRLQTLLLQVARSILPKARIPIERRYSRPLEELSEEGAFDLVVMINVVEHCYDASLAFRRVYDALKPGGVLAFHDHMYSAETPLEFFDPYHPLRVAQGVFERELLSRFKELYRKEVPGGSGPEGGWPSVYFIGEKG